MDFIRIFIHPFVSLRIVDGISHNTMNLADFVRRSISSTSRNDRYTLEGEHSFVRTKRPNTSFYHSFRFKWHHFITTLTFLLYCFHGVCMYVCMRMSVRVSVTLATVFPPLPPQKKKEKK